MEGSKAEENTTSTAVEVEGTAMENVEKKVDSKIGGEDKRQWADVIDGGDRHSRVDEEGGGEETGGEERVDERHKKEVVVDVGTVGFCTGRQRSRLKQIGREVREEHNESVYVKYVRENTDDEGNVSGGYFLCLSKSEEALNMTERLIKADESKCLSMGAGGGGRGGGRGRGGHGRGRGGYGRGRGGRGRGGYGRGRGGYGRDDRQENHESVSETPR
tara:strand:- start:198 stop:848 length:651 start_codon:yes stop_codon:yes gene_type:complete